MVPPCFARTTLACGPSSLTGRCRATKTGLPAGILNASEKDRRTGRFLAGRVENAWNAGPIEAHYLLSYTAWVCEHIVAWCFNGSGTGCDGKEARSLRPRIAVQDAKVVIRIERLHPGVGSRESVARVACAGATHESVADDTTSASRKTVAPGAPFAMQSSCVNIPVPLSS
jgi:hypothetical protein